MAEANAPERAKSKTESTSGRVGFIPRGPPGGPTGVCDDDDGAFVRRSGDNGRAVEGIAGRPGIEPRRNGLDRPEIGRASCRERVSVRVDLGGPRSIKKHTKNIYLSTNRY